MITQERLDVGFCSIVHENISSIYYQYRVQSDQSKGHSMKFEYVVAYENSVFDIWHCPI